MTENWILEEDKLKLVLLPGGKIQSGPLDDYYNRAYAHYKKTWQRIMTRLDGEGGYKAESFTQSHFISTVFHGDEVVSQMCHRIMDLGFDATQDLNYFQDFKGVGVERMQQGQGRRFLTLEWNSVNSQYSRRRSGWPFAEVTMNLSVWLARNLKADGCLAVPRRLTGVHEVCAAMGFSLMETSVIRYGCPVDIMMGFAPDFTPHAEERVEKLIGRLWNERLDFRQENNVSINPFTVTHGEIIHDRVS